MTLKEWFENKQSEDIEFWDEFFDKDLPSLLASIDTETYTHPIDTFESELLAGRQNKETTSVQLMSLYLCFGGTESEVISKLEDAFKPKPVKIKKPKGKSKKK